MNKKDDSPRIFSWEDHINREDLGGEHPYGDLGQMIAVIVFIIIWSLDSFFFRFSTILAVHIPLYLQLVLAALFFGLAGYMARSGLIIVFKEVRDPPQVINTGVFRRVRHPVYLGALLTYLGFFITTLSLISLALFAVIFIFYDYLAAFEEKQLERQFGQEYKDYVREVPRWFPRLKT